MVFIWIIRVLVVLLVLIDANALSESATHLWYTGGGLSFKPEVWFYRELMGMIILLFSWAALEFRYIHQRVCRLEPAIPSRAATYDSSSVQESLESLEQERANSGKVQ
jgi:hypothetical protein